MEARDFRKQHVLQSLNAFSTDGARRPLQEALRAHGAPQHHFFMNAECVGTPCSDGFPCTLKATVNGAIRVYRPRVDAWGTARLGHKHHLKLLVPSDDLDKVSTCPAGQFTLLSDSVGRLVASSRVGPLLFVPSF